MVHLEAKAGSSPLATVMGKPYAAELSWKEVGCTVLDTKTMNPKTVLTGCTGTAAPGETVALMGPSGAGEWYPPPPPFLLPLDSLTAPTIGALHSQAILSGSVCPLCLALS